MLSLSLDFFPTTSFYIILTCFYSSTFYLGAFFLPFFHSVSPTSMVPLCLSVSLMTEQSHSLLKMKIMISWEVEFYKRSYRLGLKEQKMLVIYVVYNTKICNILKFYYLL